MDFIKCHAQSQSERRLTRPPTQIPTKEVPGSGTGDTVLSYMGIEQGLKVLHVLLAVSLHGKMVAKIFEYIISLYVTEAEQYLS